MGAEVLVEVTRDGVVESRHRGHAVVSGADGAVLAALGDAALPILARSSLKPFQAAATLALLDGAGLDLDAASVAIACASHIGSDDHQIEAARILAEGGLDESALRCPPALPEDLVTLVSMRGVPTALAHNCSGKHAAMVVAQLAVGAEPAAYLDVDAPLQQAVREELIAVLGHALVGPAVDGCGAPAWIVPLAGLATGFARLAAGRGAYGRVRDAMLKQPELVGGGSCQDTALMLQAPGVVAKRGAEGVLAAGVVLPRLGPLGIAVKVEDGAARAAGPAVAALLAGLGVETPDAVRSAPVLGGGMPRGAIEAVPRLAELVAARVA